MAKLEYKEWVAQQTNPEFMVYIISGKNHWKKEFMTSLKELYNCDYKLVNKDIRNHLKDMNYRSLKYKKHLLMFESLEKLTETDLIEMVSYIKKPSKFGIFVLSIRDWQEKKRILKNFKYLDKNDKIKLIELDFPSQDFIKSYIKDTSRKFDLSFDSTETFKLLTRRLSSSTENIINNIETIASFTKIATKDSVKDYTEDYSNFNYNQLYESITKLNTKKVPFIAYSDLIDTGKKDISILINIKKHYELLYQAKYLKIKGILRYRDMIDSKKAIYDKGELKFSKPNIWDEPKYKIDNLLKESDEISLKEIIYIMTTIDMNLRSIANSNKVNTENKNGEKREKKKISYGVETKVDIFRTFMETMDRREEVTEGETKGMFHITTLKEGRSK